LIDELTGWTLWANRVMTFLDGDSRLVCTIDQARMAARHERATVTPACAVVWREEDRPFVTGQLDVVEGSVRLEGADRDGEVRHLRVDATDLLGVRIGREASQRIGGRPALILERRTGPPLTIGFAMSTGAVFELAEVIAEVIADAAVASAHATVVVPIKSKSAGRVRELIREGPPFDLGASPLERHQVLLTEREAIFIFEGRAVRDFAARLAASPTVWRAASAWSGHMAGRPRIAEEAFTWVRHRQDREG
jgi:hypothetical protein